MGWIELCFRAAVGIGITILSYQLGRRIERRSWLTIGQSWCNLAEQFRQGLMRSREAELREWAVNEADAYRRSSSSAFLTPHPSPLAPDWDIEQPDVVCAQCQASYPPILSECPRCKVKCATCRAALFTPGQIVLLTDRQIYAPYPCDACGKLRYQVLEKWSQRPPGIS